MIGIYAIRNRLNGECYIGSSRDIRRRWRNHRHELRRGVSEHTLLQRAWSLYGEECFELVVVQECVKDALTELENKFLNADAVYNSYKHPTGRGRKFSRTEEEKSNYRGWQHTEESKQKMSAFQRGKIVSLETREKMSKAQKGRTFSEETRAKMSKAAKNRAGKGKQHGTNAAS